MSLEQTHVSCVFLAGNLVYKVKKPVNFGFLNYSTLRRRAHWCRRELELNRRLRQREEEGISLSGADWKIYRAAKGEYSPPRRETVPVDTRQDPVKGLARIAQAAYPF